MTTNTGTPFLRCIVSTLLLLGVFFATTITTHADASLSVTVTPPLIQLTIGPGESWSSSIKVVNNNDYEVTYYTQLVDMQASGEDGRSTFIPLINESQEDPILQSFALARWIHVSSDPITIQPGASADVPFQIQVPSNAEPGGHYAAILIGTEPGALAQQGSLMKVSSFVSSLIFVRIKGDALESGRIREFSTGQSIFQTPAVDFTLRFENTGTTHLRPAGSVTIYNMWGKERGKVLINDQDANYGNVLPQSIRRFQFSWEGEQSLFDIGPYSAVVTLSYGESAKKNASATVYFWIVPLVPVSLALASILLSILLITWFIRRYIRRALMLEKERFGLTSSLPVVAPVPVIETLMEPIRAGVIDLRSITSGRGTATPTPQGTPADKIKSTSALALDSVGSSRALTLRQFVRTYRLFVAFIVVVVGMSIGGWWYFTKVLETKHGFQIRDVTTRIEPVNPQ
jgi:hypothetical protein